MTSKLSPCQRPGCRCGGSDAHDDLARQHRSNRRDFIKHVGVMGIGVPGIAQWLSRDASAADAAQTPVVGGSARRITILHTSDIHAQIDIHDEFFWEDGRPAFRRRGGCATLRTMVETLRWQNPGNTLVVDSGDCFQGSAVAALSKGQAIVPLVNAIGYDLMLPGNWEVAYGKEMMLKNLSMYSAAKVCANMFHAGSASADPIYPPYRVFNVAGIKVGFVGYNDPLTGVRQPPAYSEGIRFTSPDADLARYVSRLRGDEGCALVLVLAHLGLAQQLHLSNQSYAQGVDYILGGDTHERIREPLRGRHAKVVEPGAFGSFLGKLDIVVEDGKIKDEAYALLDVDPERYPEDPGVRTLVAMARAPYRAEIDRTIGTTKTPLLRYYILEMLMDNLITDALLWKFKTDFAVSNGFRFCPPLVPAAGGEAAITNEYLWSMLPIDSTIKSGTVTGRQITDWLENELENAFAKDATRRFGGWFVRFKGLSVSMTIGNDKGERLRSVTVGGQPLDVTKTYTMLGCEREGDRDDIICRLQRVADARVHSTTIHDVMRDYLASHSPVAPVVEGRAVATDAPWHLLSQVEGTTYTFR